MNRFFRLTETLKHRNTDTLAPPAWNKVGERGQILLALNQACAAREAAGEPITPPGLPLPVEAHGALVTEDCIQVQDHAAP